MIGQLRVVVPSLGTWVIWKECASVRFGDNCFSYMRLFERVRDHIYTWCSSIQGFKFTQNIPYLVAMKFSPPLHQRRHRITRWVLPPTRKLKLNVDASVGCNVVVAGAVLRNSHGELMLAICFSLPTSTPMWAELRAVQFALIYYACTHDQLLIETDCRLLLSYLSAPQRYTGSLVTNLQRTLQFLKLNGATLSSCPREANIQLID